MYQDEHEHVTIDEVELNPDLAPILEKSSEQHHHLCPRQIIGVRMAIIGANLVEMTIPRTDKRMMVIVETDGCFISGIEAATGCYPNRRTLRIIDYGRIAATFINVRQETAVRVYPQHDIREKAWAYAPYDVKRRYFAMLYGYQKMPLGEMFGWQTVSLTPSVRELVSRPGVRVNCAQCGEEIINERETIIAGKPICRACHASAYYQLT